MAVYTLSCVDDDDEDDDQHLLMGYVQVKPGVIFVRGIFKVDTHYGSQLPV